MKTTTNFPLLPLPCSWEDWTNPGWGWQRQVHARRSRITHSWCTHSKKICVHNTVTTGFRGNFSSPGGISLVLRDATTPLLGEGGWVCLSQRLSPARHSDFRQNLPAAPGWHLAANPAGHWIPGEASACLGRAQHQLLPDYGAQDITRGCISAAASPHLVQTWLRGKYMKHLPLSSSPNFSLLGCVDSSGILLSPLGLL